MRLPPGAAPEDVAKFLKPNAMITTDGIVKETADKIARGKRATGVARSRRSND